MSAALMWPETADWQRVFVSSTKAPLPSLKEKIFRWTFCADVTPEMKVSCENTKVSSVYSFGKAIVFTLEHLFMLLLQWRAIMKHIPHINKLFQSPRNILHQYVSISMPLAHKYFIMSWDDSISEIMAMSSVNGAHILLRVRIFLFTNTNTHTQPLKWFW